MYVIKFFDKDDKFELNLVAEMVTKDLAETPAVGDSLDCKQKSYVVNRVVKHYVEMLHTYDFTACVGMGQTITVYLEEV